MSILLVFAVALQAPAALPLGTAFGPETVISQVGSGGLRNWRPAPGRKDVLYVRDRTERWYQVTLTGPCESLQRNLDTLSYTTDPAGRFDRFSRLQLASRPYQACGVKSLRRSTPPADAPVDRQGRR